MKGPIPERVLAAVARAIDRDEDEYGIAEEVVQVLADVETTVTLALVNRVHALEEAVRRLADAAYPIADHERAHLGSSTDIVLDGLRLGPDDGVREVTVGHLRELSEATSQAEEAFWPTYTVDLAPALIGDGE